MSAIGYLDRMMNADGATTVALPNPTLSGGEPIAVSARFTVADNTGVAGTHNIAITGPINGGTSGVSITTNYGVAIFIWTGLGFVQLGPAT